MAPPVDRLRVATYNVHACVGIDGRYDPDRVAAVVSELDADIVAVQEFTYPATIALETRQPVVFTALDRYECALGPARQTVTHCFGNALLTRHPIADVQRIDLSIEGREPRSALAATVDVRGVRVHVLAAHLGLRVRRAAVPGAADSRVSGRRCAIPCSSCSATSTTGCPAARWCTSSTSAWGGRRGRGRFRRVWPMVPLDRIWIQPAAAAAVDRGALEPAGATGLRSPAGGRGDRRRSSRSRRRRGARRRSGAPRRWSGRRTRDRRR